MGEKDGESIRSGSKNMRQNLKGDSKKTNKQKTRLTEIQGN